MFITIAVVNRRCSSPLLWWKQDIHHHCMHVLMKIKLYYKLLAFWSDVQNSVLQNGSVVANCRWLSQYIAMVGFDSRRTTSKTFTVFNIFILTPPLFRSHFLEFWIRGLCLRITGMHRMTLHKISRAFASFSLEKKMSVFLRLRWAFLVPSSSFIVIIH